MKNRFCSRLALLILALCLLFTGAIAQEVDAEEWLAELRAFVGETGNRTGYTENEANACRWLERRFTEIGYTQEDGSLYLQDVPTEMEYMMKNGWEDGSVNLIATKPAAGENPGILIVSAHYDTFLGTVGAKDNGSGVAALLTLAKRYASREEYPDTEIRFVAFSCEEQGEIGSDFYAYDLSQEELSRMIGLINVDLITLDADAEQIALSCNTLGGNTPDGYRDGTRAAPIHNRISKAFEKALFEVGGYTEAQRDVDFCVPRHWADSDHMPFNDMGIDAATVCFQGNVAEGGSWPRDMHTYRDAIKAFDMERTSQALRVIDHMLDGLARDHTYGD